MCKGLIRQLEVKRGNIKSLLKVRADTSMGEKPEEEEHNAEISRAWDDVSGKELDAKGVQQARHKEIEYIEKKQVWTKVSKAEAIRAGCKIVGGRWVDVDKGDATRPDYRSRFVAKEINTCYEEGLYASTPLWRLSVGC